MPENTTNAAPVIVIGGGISGLACAIRLRQCGTPVLLLEKSTRFGGVIQTSEQDGFLFECGPQSFMLTDPLAELIDSVGLTGELMRAAPRAPRYILKNGKLAPAPLSPFSLFGTSLFDAGTKWRLLTEILRRSRPPENDESVAAFTRRKFGNSLLENLVGPFMSGVYAGDAEKLSLRSVLPQAYEWERKSGSVLRGALRQMRNRPKRTGPRPGLCSLRRGAGSLLNTIGQQLGDGARLGVAVNSVLRNTTAGSPRFEAHCTVEKRNSSSEAVTNESIMASAVVVACDAGQAGRILGQESPQFTQPLSAIPYAPVAVVAAGYRREAVGHALDGFGFLVPRKEGLRTLGTVWNSSLFPGRAPENHVLLTSFAGGATDPELCTWTENRIATTIHEELVRALGIREAPVAHHVQVYQRAIPQYNLGHGRIMETLKGLCEGMPGLYLAGNYLEGPSTGACVSRSFQIASEVEEFLSKKR